VSQQIEFIKETLSLAGAELQLRAGSERSISTKADTSLVTDADLASEKIILDRIRKTFPDDEIYSEESGLVNQQGKTANTRRRAGRFVWIVDPLDGTTNYANGYPFYCVSIGRGRYRADGSIEVVAGGVEDPCRGRTYTAELGSGAWCNGRRLSVSAPRPLAASFLVTGFHYMKGDQLKPELERFARVAQSCQSIRRDGAAALDLALVAAGTYDAFWEAGLQIWDLAAGVLLVAEAGGVVRNYTSQGNSPYNLEGHGVICGAPAIVESLTSLIGQVNE